MKNAALEIRVGFPGQHLDCVCHLSDVSKPVTAYSLTFRTVVVEIQSC